MKLPRIVFAALSISVVGFAQAPTEWRRSDEQDAFRGTSYVQFRLVGKFLSAPKVSNEIEGPVLVVRCLPGKHLRVFNGRFLTGFLLVGPVLDSQIVEHDGALAGTTFKDLIPVEYRLDDGKAHVGGWEPSTDRSSAFFKQPALNDLLYGHEVPHKENTSPPVRKVVIAIGEYLAGEIVMQFDMPDPSELADACGVIVHKK